jgi:transposase
MLCCEKEQHSLELTSTPLGMPSNKWNKPEKKTLRYLQRKGSERIEYLQALRKYVTQHGSEEIVYIDESGFSETTFRPYAWSQRGKKVYGEQDGKTRKRTSLIAGKRGSRLLAPVLLTGTTNAVCFNHWLEHHLLPELNPHSLLIMDNAPFHQKKEIRAIAALDGHSVLFLPPYSPDFNKIEEDFAILKKQRIYAPPETTLDDIVRLYGT